MARAAGEFDFNVARALGQSKSKIVDTIYAQTMASGLASVSRSVTERGLGTAQEPSQAPPPPAAAAELAALAKRIQELLAQVPQAQQEPPAATAQVAPGRPALSVIPGGRRETRK